MREPLLKLRGLQTHFFTEDGVVKAVRGVDFEVYEGETLGIVGESGCGKSVTALSIMGLVDYPGKIVAGEIIFKGEDLTKKSYEEMRQIRGKEIAMIFQEPMTALNPVFTVGYQISEALMIHLKMSEKEAMKHSIELLRKVGIPIPEQRVHEYPHQLSGGMRQRAMIAMALSCNPSLIIADEPTTALDVTIQAQILDLMKSLQKEYGASLIMITHDLGVIAEIADRVVVMYAGKVVEYADVKTIFHRPLHPYTFGLLTSIPRLDVEVDRLNAIPGVVPDPLHFPNGCGFNTRCHYAIDRCREEDPPLIEVEEGHWVRCWNMDAIRREVQKGLLVGV